MSERRIFHGPTPVLQANGKLLLPWAKEDIPICGPARFYVDVRESAFDLTAFGPALVDWDSTAQNNLDPHPCFSGLRGNVPFDGPFWCYEPRRLQNQGGVYRTADRGVGQFFFDLSPKRPIYLPYDGTLSLMGCFPGTWELNIVYLPSDERCLDIESQLPLTFGIQPHDVELSAFRNFNAIPPGAHGYTYRDSGSNVSGGLPVLSQSTQKSPVRGVPGGGGAFLMNTSYALADPFTQAQQFGGRWGLSNCEQLSIVACAPTSEALVQFHVSLL